MLVSLVRAALRALAFLGRFEPTPLWHEYFLVRAGALPNLSPTNPKFAQLIRLWRRLPVRVSQLLGPPVAKYLG